MPFHQIRIYDYIQVSSQAVLLFDYFITFSDEVEYIWGRKANPATILFYVTRYLPFFDGTIHLAKEFLPTPSHMMCNILYHLQGWIYIFAYLVADSILILRTYAMWKNNKNIALSLCVLLVACITGAGYCLEKFILSLTLGPSPSRSAFPGCFIYDGGRILWVSYLLLQVFHAVVFILTLLKVIQQRRLKDSSLFRTIYRDGIMIYAYLFGFSLINIIVLNTAQTYLEFSLASTHRVLQAILTGRLVMNIRRAANQSPRDLMQVTAFDVPGSYRGLEAIPLTNMGRN